MAELHIPDQAAVNLWNLVDDIDAEDTDLASLAIDVRVIARPVVAAELRRLAAHLVETFSPDTPQIHSVASSIRARADELCEES